MVTVKMTNTEYEAYLLYLKSIEEVKEKEEIPFVNLFESSLEKEWSSKEDNIRDTWVQEKLQSGFCNQKNKKYEQHKNSYNRLKLRRTALSTVICH